MDRITPAKALAAEPLKSAMETAVREAIWNGRSATFPPLPCYGELAGKDLFKMTDIAMSAWLSKNLGIFVDSPVTVLGLFTFWFDWSIQEWRVATDNEFWHGCEERPA